MAGADIQLIGSELRALRLRLGLSLAQAANGAGLSRSALSHWELNMRSPNGPALESLLAALEVEDGMRARLLSAADPAHARSALAHSPTGAPIEIGQILRGMRLRAGTTQAQVARQAGLAQSTVAKWEAGDALPDEETLVRALDALVATPQERMHIAESPHVTTTGIETGIDAVYQRLNRIVRMPFAFQEVSLLLIERELWHLATFDKRWEGALITTMGWRAYWYAQDLNEEKAKAVAKQAFRLARASDLWDEAWVAYRAVRVLRDLDATDPWEVVELDKGFATRLQRPEVRIWFDAFCAIKLSLVDDPRARGALEPALRAMERGAWQWEEPFLCTQDEFVAFMAHVQSALNDDGVFDTVKLLSPEVQKRGDIQVLPAMFRLNIAVNEGRELPEDALAEIRRSSPGARGAPSEHFKKAWTLREYERVHNARLPELKNWRRFRARFDAGSVGR